MSNKSRLVHVTDLDDVDAIRAAGNGLSVPFYHYNQATQQLWADAEQYRAWRALRASQATSEGVK